MDTILPTRLVVIVFVIYCHISATRAENACANGWDYYNDSCYIFIGVTASFNSSNYACISNYGASLASVHSAEEETFLKNKMVAEGQTDAWIGLFKEQPDSCGTNLQCLRSNWRWVDGTPYDYHNWLQAEPGSGEGCARLTSEGNVKGMDCRELYNYMCKRVMVTPTTTTTTTTTTEATTAPSTNTSTTMTTPSTVQTLVTTILKSSVITMRPASSTSSAGHSPAVNTSPQQNITAVTNTSDDGGLDALTISLIVVWCLTSVPITLVIVLAAIYISRQREAKAPMTSC